MIRKITLTTLAIICIGLFTFNLATAQDSPLDSPAVSNSFPVIFEAKYKAVLSAEQSGVLKQLKYDVGDTIKKKALIASVDVGELVLRKKRSGLALRHLEVQVKDLSGLKKQGLATNEDLAKARMERDVTRTDISIFKHQIGKSNIYAPFNCQVVRRHVQRHEWVTLGQPVMDVVNLDEIRAVANIPAALAVKLAPGMTHTFDVSDLGVQITGKVFAVSPEVDERSNTAQVIWTVEPAGKRLLPGMKGEVRFDS